MTWIHLEDIEVGLEVESEPRTVTAGDIEAFATLTGDHNPLHADPEAIASGQPTSADDWALGIYLEESRRFVAPVYVGDAIRSLSTVTEVRRSRSKPDRGIVTMEVRVVNQRDEVVQESVDVVLVGARASAG